jgi:hypothetical protein
VDLPALQGILLVTLFVANPHRIDRESRVLRILGLTLAALISFANAWSLVGLAIGLVRGTEGENRLGIRYARAFHRNDTETKLWHDLCAEPYIGQPHRGLDLGYVRVSTTNKSLGRQTDALAAGIPAERPWADEKTGATVDRDGPGTRCPATPGQSARSW